MPKEPWNSDLEKKVLSARSEETQRKKGRSTKTAKPEGPVGSHPPYNELSTARRGPYKRKREIVVKKKRGEDE